MIRRPPISTLSSSSAASDVYKRQLSDLAASAVLCSSVDDLQLPGHVLEEQSDAYWSSSGSLDQESEEFIVLQLKQPMCVVRSVTVQFWAAWWLPEKPVYNCRSVALRLGHTPECDSDVLPDMDCRATSAPQEFRVDAGPLCK
eukprot:TRINITY_DN14036_c0_g1_i1.p2 TRINITY_DN14036_c0_g1~~TRINITY_DN14036_c0_g1_i1.p2  ORF type:complete len:143 (+),score=39.12 TRINITY_DN14036_c0_g1_i1:96-524(+)